MSKLSPLGQSMAALFTPEGERMRAGKKESASRAAPGQNSIRIPGPAALREAGKSQDSLGNPMSPGYEPLPRKGEEAGGAEATEASPPSQAQSGFRSPELSPNFIRLSSGWEKVLMAQKKLCEKAKNLFTLLEGPTKYKGQKKSTLLERKSRGAILDLDLEETQQAAQETEKKNAA